ncbi:putative rhamnogalacturonate lyase C [Cladorrhinum sp. PSN332]|nr:putative rhamnogalacturonate lyase C [Cladorrhinum sp. PSN332]
MLSHILHPLFTLNTLLIFLRLRRPSPWEPPTLLDSLISSPLNYIATLLYHTILLLRGHSFHPPKDKSPIRVVCLSDTHTLTLPPSSIPDGDLLIHCGDLTNDGTPEEIQVQVDWLNSLKGRYKYKLVIGGNHDGWLDRDVRRRGLCGGGSKKKVDWKELTYLEGKLVTLEFDDGNGRGGKRRLNVFGRGDVPRCGGDDFAFQYDRGKHPWRGAIPDETDVLITHGPPRHHRDLGLGCDGLLEEVWRVKPKLHVFGHTHWGHGREAVYFDECQRAYETLMSKPARGLFWDLVPSNRWMDAFNILRYGVSNLLWKWIMLGPGSNNGGLMVNAAVMYGNTGKLKNRVNVVDL